MRKLLLCLAPALLIGCLPGDQDLVLNTPTAARAKPTDKPAKASGPFALDHGTVFLADFEGNAVNAVTGQPGSLQFGSYVKALYGSGVRKTDSAYGKFLVDYPASEALSLTGGTLEALVRYDSVAYGFSHIIDKSWQYALSAYDGHLAAWFGSDWWYTDVTLPVGKWSYVAATFDGKTLKLYLNGALAASTPYAGNGNSQYSTQYDLGIGNAAADGFDIPFNGTLDAVRISRCTRSAAEIAQVEKGIGKRAE